MLFFGHRFLKNEIFYHISDIEAIEKTPPNTTIFLEFKEENLDIIEYLNENSINSALSALNTTEILYSASLNANYIVVPVELAKTAQSIAESYLFDAKILVMLENEDQIEEMALLGIDGVIFSNAIIKINS